MDDPVLTDDEKNALLDGVSSGAVAVQSASGAQYASVAPYVIGRRSRIVSNSYPRLQSMNEQLAERLAAGSEALLHRPVSIIATAIRRHSFAEQVDATPPRCAVVPFTATPLSGTGLVVLNTELIGHLVEGFFGGGGSDEAMSDEAVLSPGALGVARLFVRQVLATVRDVWLPLKQLAPEQSAIQPGVDMVDAIGDDDAILASDFEVTIGDQRGKFTVVWPVAMIAAQIAALEGKPAERNAAADAQFERAMRRRLADISIALCSEVGHADMTLGALISLAPGDVIDIDSPRTATVQAGGIALLAGRFGVQAGRNAVEATSWLDSQTDTHQRWRQ